MESPSEKHKLSFFNKIIPYFKKKAEYYITDVWNDPSDSIKVRLIKTINLSIKSFLNKDLQSISMSLTYVSALAIVPILAILFAFGRAFGLQEFLQEQVYLYFPSQHKALSAAFSFVDSYLEQTSQGVFLGVGLIVLLWTVISLMSRIEDTFNQIWNVKTQRTIFRKVIDYTAFCIFVPILMTLSSGVSIMVSTTLDGYLTFLSPVWNIILDTLPFLLVWIAFTFSFVLIPNTNVTFKYGAISGFICGIAFQTLQFLFVNGQIYVSKYNAVYGSFSFLPLMLVWLQLSWLILLCGCMITYSAQNVFGYNYTDNTNNMSTRYFQKVSCVILAIIIKRFDNMQNALSVNELAMQYDLPVSVVKLCIDKFKECGLVNFVEGEKGIPGIAPSFNQEDMTVGGLISILENSGKSDFIPRFAIHFNTALQKIESFMEISESRHSDVLIKNLIIPHPDDI